MKRVLCALMLLWPTGPLFANEANEKLVAMSEQDRHAAFTEEIKRSKLDCDTVERSMLLNDDGSRRALWSVACRNGASYAVTVYADAQMRPFAVSCVDLKDYGRLLNIMERRAGQPSSDAVAECWKKF